MGYLDLMLLAQDWNTLHAFVEKGTGFLRCHKTQ
jgi:hypothetical protein